MINDDVYLIFETTCIDFKSTWNVNIHLLVHINIIYSALTHVTYGGVIKQKEWNYLFFY